MLGLLLAVQLASFLALRASLSEHAHRVLPARLFDRIVVVIGITDYAQKQLGDVVYVSLPAPGPAVTAGEPSTTVASAHVAKSTSKAAATKAAPKAKAAPADAAPAKKASTKKPSAGKAE